MGGGTSSGDNSFSASYGIATGNVSSAIAGGEALGSGSIAFGGYDLYTSNHNVAAADTSSAIGGLVNSANGELSFAAGYHSNADALAAVAIGSLNKGGGTTNGWVQTDPLFELGNGWSYTPVSTDRSNAITTLKNGRTTLTNKFWSSTSPTDVPTDSTQSNAEALVVEGHSVIKGNAKIEGDTTLQGKVILLEAQGDISMGVYGP